MSSEGNLASRAVRGGSITILGQAVRIGLQFAGLVVLSRLLEPSSFGIVALAQVMISAGEVVRDLGLTQAAVQADRLSRPQLSNLFWVSLAIAGVLVVLGLAAEPVVGSLFGKPGLGPVLAALLPLFVLNAGQTPFQVDMIRKAQYGRLVCADVIAQAAGLIVCCTAAIAGWREWALVAQALTIGIIALLLKGALSRWHPTLPTRGVGTRPLLTFGLHLSGAQVLNIASTNADTAVLGYTSSAGTVGLYNRGYQLLSAPLQQLLAPLTNVAVSLLAQSRHDKAAFLIYLRRAQAAIAIPVSWIFATSVALAEPIVGVLLGEGWEQTAKVFQVLAVGGAFQQLSFVSFWAFLSLGLTRELLKYNITTKLCMIAAIVSGSHWGMVGVAWAVSGSLAASWLVNLAWLARTARLPARPFLLAGGRVLFLAAIAGACGRLAHGALSPQHPWSALPAGVITSAIVYMLLILAVPSTRAEVTTIARNLRQRSSQ